MFEKWVEGLIVEYFSEWLEGFDKDGMRVGLFSGKICFQNLKFKKQALDKLKLPIALKEGRLGTLNVKVPWKHLSKESVRIVLEDLYILVGPTHDDSSESRTTVDDRRRQSKQHEIRMRQLLQDTDEGDKVPTSPKESSSSSSSSSSSWKKKMFNLIMDNLTFELKRIHIRYEDTSRMVSSRPISFGMSIDELKISTTNANGHVTFMDRSTSHTPFVHKVFALVEAYVYWDLVSAHATTAVHESTAAPDMGTKMTYLIEPITTTVKITENHDEASHQFIPQYRVHIAIGALKATVSPNQCKDITNVLDYLMSHELYVKRSHCRKARPGCTVQDNPRRWWKYAITSIQLLEHNPDKCTWRKALALLVLRDKYIGLYMRQLTLEAKLPDVDAQALRLLEDDERLSPDCIVFFRACAAEELDHEEKRRKQLAKAAPSKWTSILKKSTGSKPTTPVASPRAGGFFSPKSSSSAAPPTAPLPTPPTSGATTPTGATTPASSPSRGGFFSPKQAVTQPSSPTTATTGAVVPITLDPTERQLVYEGVSDRFFTPPTAKKTSLHHPLSTTDKGASIWIALEVTVDEVVCAVAKEDKAGTSSRKEFIRFQVHTIHLSYSQHVRAEKTRPPEMNAVFEIHDMQLVDATQPPESPLAVIFGHAHKPKSNALVQIKYHRLPDTASLAITIDACNVLYHKKAFDKITKYVTPDQPSSSSSAAPSVAAGATKAVPAETSTHDDDGVDAASPALPLQLTLLMTDVTLSVAGETAATPFVVLHLAQLQGRSANVYEQLDVSIESVDPLLVGHDQVAGLWDDVSLQANCRLAKKFKLEWTLTLHRDDVNESHKPTRWGNLVRLSFLAVNVSEAQCRHVHELIQYLAATHVKAATKPKKATPSSSAAAPPRRRRRAMPVDIALIIPVLSLRIVGTDSLRDGLYLEATKWDTTVKWSANSVFSVHAEAHSMLAREAQASTSHRQYSFGMTLVDVAEPWSLSCVMAGGGAPILRLSLPAVKFCWHYHLLQQVLQLFVAPLPLPDLAPFADAGDALFLHLDVHIESWVFVLNPIETTDIVIRGGDLESTVQVLLRGDVVVDATAAAVVCEMDAWTLFAFPDTSVVHYEASGVYALADRDGAAAYVDAKLTRGTVAICQPQLTALGVYMAAYVTQLFSWLYLAREGQGRTIMDPAKLRLKMQATVEALDLSIPTQLVDRTCDEAMQVYARDIVLSSSRYLDSPYEQLNVDVAHFVIAPWWSHDETTSLRVQYVMQINDLRQQITVAAPQLRVAFDASAYNQVLAAVRGNFLAPTYAIELATPLPPVETTLAVALDDMDVTLVANVLHVRVHALHVTVHDQGAHQTVDMTWQSLRIQDTNKDDAIKCGVHFTGRQQRLEYEREPSSQQTLGVSLDGLHAVPDVELLQAWAAFVAGLVPPPSSSSSPAAPLDLSVNVKSLQLQLYHDMVTAQRVVVHGKVRATVLKQAVRVEGRAMTLVVATVWPLPSTLTLADPLHFCMPRVGRGLVSPFQIDIDVADRALQVTLSPLDVVVGAADLWLVHATAMRYVPRHAPPSSSSSSDYFVSVVLQQVTLTLVAPTLDVDPSVFTPKIRLYGHRALLKSSYKCVSATSISTEWSLQFTDERCDSVDDGVSVWCFNAALGVWEPWVEPWACHVSVVHTVEDDTTIQRVSCHGREQQQCRVNYSTAILDCVGAIVAPLVQRIAEVPPISPPPLVEANAACGVFVCNDTALAVDVDIGDGAPPTTVDPHATNPLDLHTQPLLVSDQTISLRWAHTWQPLHDIRLHAFGPSVVVVAPVAADATKPPAAFMPLLLDVEARHGRRTLTISSIVKVYNDCEMAVRVGCLRDGHSTILDAGVVAAQTSMGLPLDMCETLHGLRLVVRPTDATDDKVYQWSDPFAVEAPDPLVAACALETLPCKNCACMPSFSTTSPQLSSTEQLCAHGKVYFKVVPHVRTAGHAAFASIRVLAPLTVENQCPVPLSLLVFTTKKHGAPKPAKAAKGAVLDEEIEPIQLHLVMSTTLAPHSKRHVHVASLLHKSYAVLALTSQQWSQLLPLDKEREAIVTLKDGYARTNAVNWATSTLPSCQLHTTFWPTYVLVDDSKLRVLYDVELTSKKSLKSILHLSGNKVSQHQSATDTLETDVIEATLEVLSEMVPIEPPPPEKPALPYLLSGTSHVNIRLDPTRSLRTSTASVNLDVVSDSVQNCHRLFSDSAREWHDIGVRVTLTTTTRTKIVTFVPRYMVLNTTPYPFLFCPSTLVHKTPTTAASTPSPRPTLTPVAAAAASAATTPDPVADSVADTSAPAGVPPPPRQTSSGRLGSMPPTQPMPIGVATFAPSAPFAPFHWSAVAEPSDYSVRIKPAETTGWKWSGKFNLHEVGETALNVINRSTNQVHVVRIHIRVLHATQICVVLSLEEATTPLYRLVNDTTTTIQFCQKFDMDPGFVREVAPADSVWFGWDEAYACDERALYVMLPALSLSTTVVVDHIHDDVVALGTDANPIAFLQVHLDGLTKVLHVGEHRHTRDTLMRRQSASKVQKQNVRYVVDVLLPSVVLSLVHLEKELVVVTIQESSIIGGYTPDGNDIEVKVQSVQVDNQHESSATFPVLFAPNKEDSPAKQDDSTTATDGTSGAGEPFFHLSLVRLFYHPDIEFVKYLSVLLRPATLQLDASIVFSVAEMVSDWLRLVMRYFPDLMVEKPVSLLAQKVQSEPRVYFETLQLHPLKLCVTFTQSTLPSQAEDVMAVVPGMFRILQTHLANIDNAPLHLNALHIFHSYTSISLLVSSVRQHYTTQALRQIYSLIGSAEILGNPLGLVSNLGSGVKDFFYEPAAGMVRGPGQFVKGLTKGTESLVKNSVYGTFNAASKLTGSISTGLATLSMDKVYIQSRTNRPKKDGPTNVGAGLLLGTKQLGQGILAGVSGIITQPAMGAYHNGLTGFVEGVGKGIIGAAVKPTAGILDLAAQTTAGITYSAASFDKKPKLKRLRLPRMMATVDKRLTIYAAEEASVACWLNQLPTNTLSAPSEQYHMHVLLPPSRAVVATTSQLMVLDTSAKLPRVLWAYPVKNIRSSESGDDGIQITLDTDSGETKVVKIALDKGQNGTRDRIEALVCKLVSRRQSNTLI
ncbi:Aste57867_13953 [Aphanomyces stellatus]|uniref:Aste57867_13953 protein n=1 Tax=Aphanomyces stellatus TaxID=120398 RepID=A0A485KZR7_9STRA|nr:hypothetical protein As57867_013902 [Aphanomyces stellatus]VFT90783.1 Aste57867_13953 [Aphanomyces stellatus]